MVVMWTCGDIFKTMYFLLRDAPVQFWVCGSIQVVVDLLILLQVFIYRDNVEPQHTGPHRGDWVVIIWTHDEIRHHKEKASAEVAILNEKREDNDTLANSINKDVILDNACESLQNSDSSASNRTETENNYCCVISADVHNENEAGEDAVGKTVPVDIVNNARGKYTLNGDTKKRASHVSYKERAKHKVSMLIHRHTLWHTPFIASIGDRFCSSLILGC